MVLIVFFYWFFLSTYLVVYSWIICVSEHIDNYCTHIIQILIIWYGDKKRNQWNKLRVQSLSVVFNKTCYIIMWSTLFSFSKILFALFNHCPIAKKKKKKISRISIFDIYFGTESKAGKNCFLSIFQIEGIYLL